MYKFSWVFLIFLGVSSSYVILNKVNSKNEAEELGLETYMFEDVIAGVLDLLKKFLKDGDPNSGIPPLDPFFLSRQDFELSLNDTDLEGYFANLTISNFSDFAPKKIQLDLLPILFKLDLFFDQLSIKGNYKLTGNLLGRIPINGKGRFTSKTTNLTLSLLVNPVVENSYIQINNFSLSSKVLGEKINFTNELESGELQSVDEKIALQILDEVNFRYLPLIVQTLKLIANDFLQGYSIEDLINIILELINIKAQ